MNTRVYSLDLMRFISCVLVVFFHYFFLSCHLGFTDNKIDFFKYGFVGVYVFFFISGFVIWGSVSNKSAKSFLKNRIIRLYPQYWISVLISTYILLVLWKYDIGFLTILSNFTMLQKMLGQPDLDGVYWTLFVEIVFYFWICFLHKLQFKKNTVINFFIVMIIIDNIFYVNDKVRVILLLEYLPFFTSGIIASNLFVKLKKYDALKLLLILLFSVEVIISKANNMTHIYKTEFSIYICVFIYILSLLFMYFVRGEILYRYKDKIIFLGLLTYPIYLYHQNIGYYLINFFIVKNNFELIVLGSSVFTFIIFLSIVMNKLEGKIFLFLRKSNVLVL